MSATLRVCSLYPELMNIYADRGNIAVLRARCEWRGLGFEHAASTLAESLDPGAHDLFYMGGGQDRDQAAVAHDMAATKRDALHTAAGRVTFNRRELDTRAQLDPISTSPKILEVFHEVASGMRPVEPIEHP